MGALGFLLPSFIGLGINSNMLPLLFNAIRIFKLKFFDYAEGSIAAQYSYGHIG